MIFADNFIVKLYFFRETLYRVNITDHKNGSQTFNEMKVQEYDYDASNGTDNDIIIVPDIPYIVSHFQIIVYFSNNSTTNL